MHLCVCLEPWRWCARSAVEIRRFKDDVSRVVGYFAVHAAHDPGDTDRAVLIRYQSMFPVSLRSFPSRVTKEESLPARRTIIVSPSTHEKSKSVHRLAVLEHHVVVMSDNVVYRSYAARRQSFAHPARRAIRTSVTMRAVARTQIGIMHFDLQQSDIRSIALYVGSCVRIARQTLPRIRAPGLLRSGSPACYW